MSLQSVLHCAGFVYALMIFWATTLPTSRADEPKQWQQPRELMPTVTSGEQVQENDQAFHVLPG